MSIATVEITTPPRPYAGFVYFLLRTLSQGTKAPCPIWLEAYDRSTQQVSLSRAMEAGEEISLAMLVELQREGLRAGYVRTQDLLLFQEYIAQSLRQTLVHPRFDYERIASLVYEQALCAIKAAMLDPKNGRRLAQGASLVRDMVQRIWLDEELRRKLMLMMTGDDHLYAHAINTCLLGVSLARFLAWPHLEAEGLALSLFFHDLGMAEVPEELLRKQGPLSKQERQLMQNHPHASYQLVKALPHFNEATLEAIRNHHENLDGSGYPRGLAERQLSRMTRVARIADVYEAMTSARSWRPAIKPFEALTKMRKDMKEVLDLNLLKSFTASLAIFGYDEQGVVPCGHPSRT